MTKTTSNTYFINIPNDIYQNLCEYLNYRDLVNLKNVCQIFKNYLQQDHPFILRQQADCLAKKWIHLDLLKNGFRGLSPQAPLVLKTMGLALTTYVEVGHLDQKFNNIVPPTEKQVTEQNLHTIFTQALDHNQKDNFQQVIQEAKTAHRFLVGNEEKRGHITDLLEIAQQICQLICQIIK